MKGGIFMSIKKVLSYTLVFFFLLFSFMLFNTIRSSASVPAPAVLQNTFVYDQASILSDDTEKIVNKMLNELEAKTSAEVAIITTPSLYWNSLEDYANKLFNQLGIGKKGKDNGVLLLISADNKKVRLEIGRGLEGVLTDSISGRILDDYFVPYRKINDYDSAVYFTASAVANKIAASSGVVLNGTDENASVADAEELPDIFYTIIAIAIIIGMIILYFVNPDLFWMIILSFLSCGRSSSGGSSSHSGRSSGGSFGGGFSGGGGASR